MLRDQMFWVDAIASVAEVADMEVIGRRTLILYSVSQSVQEYTFL
jgi:hypothetical protein